MPSYHYSDFTLNYFSKIDTPDKAYITGFIAGDGYIAKDTNTVSIDIHVKDEPILSKIKKAMRLQNPLTYQRDSVRIRFTNVQIKQDLNKIGIHTNKSLTIGPPRKIPTFLIPHFTRGLVDADGCFTYSCTEKKLFKYKFNITGNKPLLDYCNNNLPVCGYIYDRTVNTASLEVFKKEDIVKTGNYLYSNEGIFLQRKKDKFFEMKTLINTN